MIGQSHILEGKRDGLQSISAGMQAGARKFCVDKTASGRFGEKTLHAALKAYYEPDAESHEIKIGRYIADIVGENGIIEIQTQSFDKLRKKLEAFLSVTHVSVVYPVAAVKKLLWIDPQTGEVSKPRKSPRKGVAQDVFRELYKIRPLLLHPNLSIRIAILEIEEYRCRAGWSADGKKGATRCDRIPSAFIQEIVINAPSDYRQLLPKTLPSPFIGEGLSKSNKNPPLRCTNGAVAAL